MREIVLLNLESIFFPARATEKRVVRKDHLYESILITWPAFFVYALFEVIFKILDVNTFFLNYLSLVMITLSLLLFPIYIWLYAQVNFLVLRIFLPASFNDTEIDAIIGSMVSSNLFYLLPLIGPIISFISSKIILFSCLRQRLSVPISVCVLLGPILLSMVIIAFLAFCLALFFFFFALF